MDDFNDDWYFEDEDYEYFDTVENEDCSVDDNILTKIGNDIDFYSHKGLSDKEKIIILYNIIKVIYSYLLTIQDVV